VDCHSCTVWVKGRSALSLSPVLTITIRGGAEAAHGACMAQQPNSNPRVGTLRSRSLRLVNSGCLPYLFLYPSPLSVGLRTEFCLSGGGEHLTFIYQGGQAKQRRAGLRSLLIKGRRGVHDWANKNSLKQGKAGWKAEKAWICFTEKGLRKFSFRSGDAGVS